MAPKQRRLPPWFARASRAALLGLLVAAAVVYNQSAVHWRDNISDSHYYAYCGWRVSQGAVPYLDVWDNKPPGTWWVNAVAYWVCGKGVQGEILVCSAALATALLGFVALGRAAYHPSLWPLALAVACVLLTHLRYECGGNRTETFVVPGEIVAVLGYLRWRRGGHLGWLAVGGLFAGAAPLFKQSGLGALGACLAHLLWSDLVQRKREPASGRSRWLPWVVWAAAVTALPAIAAAFLASRGALREAWFAAVTFNRSYFAVGDATWFRLRGALASYAPELAPLTGLFVLAGVGAVLLGLRRFRRRPDPAPEDAGGGECIGVFWLWLVFALYLDCVGPGRLAYHLTTILPPLGLLALYPLHWLLGGRELSRRLVAHPSVGVAIVVYLYALSAPFGDSLAVARRCWAKKPTWHALVRSRPEPYEVQARKIRRLTRPDAKVYVWGWSPGTYRFAYRHSPSRFSTLEKPGQVGAHARFIHEGAVRDILRAPPAVIAISGGDLSTLLSPPLSQFARWLEGHYRDSGDVEGMHILTWQD